MKKLVSLNTLDLLGLVVPIITHWKVQGSTELSKEDEISVWESWGVDTQSPGDIVSLCIGHSDHNHQPKYDKEEREKELGEQSTVETEGVVETFDYHGIVLLEPKNHTSVRFWGRGDIRNGIRSRKGSYLGSSLLFVCVATWSGAMVSFLVQR